MNCRRLRGKTPAYKFRPFCPETSHRAPEMPGRLCSGRDTVSPGLDARFDAFDEDEPFPLGQYAYRLEAVGVERGCRLPRRHERRPALRPREDRAEPSTRRRADDERAAAGPQHADELANRLHPV